MIGTAVAPGSFAHGLADAPCRGHLRGLPARNSRSRRQQRLVDEQRDLDIVEARLSRQENLEALAKRRDLSAPTAAQIVHLDPKGDSKLALNRH